MLFNSLEFFVFFGLFALLWPYFKRTDLRRWGFLTIMSLVFYGWWDWRFLFLILFSGWIDFWAARAMVRVPKRKRLYLWVSLLGNLGSLGIFKYSEFIAENLSVFFGWIGWEVDLVQHLPAFTLILPVGISFYTFQSMSYTLDVYYGRIRPVRHALHFFAYLVMFPQLVAGPIVRARDLLHQLTRVPDPGRLSVWVGFKMFLFGLFQKVVLADNIAFLVDSVFQGKSPYTDAPVYWLAAIGFAFQIYCDFSGYSLMARGVARMLGYHFRMNFNHPYRARSFRDFWRRWHISLSTWFRDYVYIPLGGSRSGFARGLFYMVVTMVISGFWHGANWNFVIWGALHGMFLVGERLAHRTSAGLRAAQWSWLTYPTVFFGVLVGWVFFRATSLEEATMVFNGWFNGRWSLDFLALYGQETLYVALAVGVEVVLRFNRRKAWQYRMLRYPVWDAASMAALAALCLFLRGPEADFIYFQF